MMRPEFNNDVKTLLEVIKERLRATHCECRMDIRWEHALSDSVVLYAFKFDGCEPEHILGVTVPLDLLLQAECLHETLNERLFDMLQKTLETCL